MTRIFNFSSGPAVLPEPVLAEAQRDLMELPGVGMSVLEISHRSKPFDAIIGAAVENLRKVGGIPANYQVLFLQGGASLQFSMVPLNFLPPGGAADYFVTGTWSQKAVAEARKAAASTSAGATINIAASTEADNFTHVPEPGAWTLDPRAAYVHFTTNETIAGIEWPTEPDTAGVPLIADASSDIFSRPIDVSKYAMIYAGAQKNLGPSGVTLVIVRDDMLARIPKGLPTMLDYTVHAKERSLYNTPPVFGIYIIGLVAKWILDQGGLAAVGRANADKARTIYDVIDRSNGFYRPHAKPTSRSTMNITFRLPSEPLEKQFITEATRAGLDGLAGHRSVGGVRASIYNAFPAAGITALASFMADFAGRAA
jgi:phosphoserine aminotransferase